MRQESEQIPLEKELTERMLDLMVRQELITSAVFGNQKVMEMICRNQVCEIMTDPEIMYVTVAELDYKKLKDYDLITCYDRADIYWVLLEDYEQMMGGQDQARSYLIEQMISDLSEELGVC